MGIYQIRGRGEVGRIAGEIWPQSGHAPVVGDVAGWKEREPPKPGQHSVTVPKTSLRIRMPSKCETD